MIIKFDHISYITERNKLDVLNIEGEPLFCEKRIHNIRIKRLLMREFQENHDLIFFDNVYPPVEYIFYDRVNGKSTIRVQDGIIYGQYTDEKLVKYFLEQIFGKNVLIYESNLQLNMRGILDKRDYWLKLEKIGGGRQSNPTWMMKVMVL